MTTWSPDASKKIALVSDLAAMASSVDDGLSEIVSVRQGHTYVWADAAGRSVETGMTPGSTGVQLDTGGIYTYLTGLWRLTGGTLPTFIVRGTGSQSIAASIPTTLSSLWGAPTVNHGFSAWASGILTVAEAGVYMLLGTIAFDSDTPVDVTRLFVIADAAFDSDLDTDFYQRVSTKDVLLSTTTFATLAAGATIKLAAWNGSASAIDTDPVVPSQNMLGVRYIGPAI